MTVFTSKTSVFDGIGLDVIKNAKNDLFSSKKGRFCHFPDPPPGNREIASSMRGNSRGVFGGFFRKKRDFRGFWGFSGYLSSKRKRLLHCAQLIFELSCVVAQCNGHRF